MEKRRKIMMMSILLSFVFVCSIGNSGKFLKQKMTDTKNGGVEMKHEILTVKEIKGDCLTAVDYQGKEYRISDLKQYAVDFQPGKRIGVSYTEKAVAEDGSYTLCIVGITKEGDGTAAPLE